LDARTAPQHAPINAGITIAKSKRPSVFIDLRYLIAAVEVPKNAAVLEVPTTETGLLLGKAKSIAGV
jgi:hypothetical protein